MPLHLTVCRAVVCAGALLAGFTAVRPAYAQTGSTPQPPVVQLEWLREHPYAATGKIAIYEGDADAAGVVLAIPAGTAFSRCVLAVAAVTPGKPLTVRLRNDLSNGWDRTATTDAGGKVEIAYRTEGTAMAFVQSPDGRQRFRLMVLQGHEIPVHKTKKPAVASKDTAAARGGSGGEAPVASSSGSAPAAGPAESTPIVYWVIAVLLGGLLLVGAIAVFRRKV